MKDSERATSNKFSWAKTYLGDLFTRRPGSYVRATQDADAIAELMDLLAEVREDERNKHLRPGPIERLEQIFGPSNPDLLTYEDFEGDFWQEDAEDRNYLHLVRGVPVESKILKDQVDLEFGPLKLVGPL